MQLQYCQDLEWISYLGRITTTVMFYSMLGYLTSCGGALMLEGVFLLGLSSFSWRSLEAWPNNISYQHSLQPPLAVVPTFSCNEDTTVKLVQESKKNSAGLAPPLLLSLHSKSFSSSNVVPFCCNEFSFFWRALKRWNWLRGAKKIN